MRVFSSPERLISQISSCFFSPIHNAGKHPQRPRKTDAVCNPKNANRPSFRIACLSHKSGETKRQAEPQQQPACLSLPLPRGREKGQRASVPSGPPSPPHVLPQLPLVPLDPLLALPPAVAAQARARLTLCLLLRVDLDEPLRLLGLVGALVPPLALPFARLGVVLQVAPLLSGLGLDAPPCCELLPLGRRLGGRHGLLARQRRRCCRERHQDHPRCRCEGAGCYCLVYSETVSYLVSLWGSERSLVRRRGGRRCVFRTMLGRHRGLLRRERLRGWYGLARGGLGRLLGEAPGQSCKGSACLLLLGASVCLLGGTSLLVPPVLSYGQVGKVGVDRSSSNFFFSLESGIGLEVGLQLEIAGVDTNALIGENGGKIGRPPMWPMRAGAAMHYLNLCWRRLVCSCSLAAFPKSLQLGAKYAIIPYLARNGCNLPYCDSQWQVQAAGGVSSDHRAASLSARRCPSRRHPQLPSL